MSGYLSGYLDDIAKKLSTDLKIDPDKAKKCLESFQQEQKEKMANKKIKDPRVPQTITLVLDYTDKSHVLVGDTRQYKDIMMQNREIFSPKKLASFGFGWIISKSKLELAEKILSNNKVPYISKKYKENEKEEEKEETISLTMNKWGNMQDSAGVIYSELPIGYNGSPDFCAIGKQDTSCKKKGLVGVLPLSNSDEFSLKDRGIIFLDNVVLEKLQRYDSVLYTKMREILGKRQNEKTNMVMDNFTISELKELLRKEKITFGARESKESLFEKYKQTLEE